MNKLYELLTDLFADIDLKMEKNLVTDGYIDSFDIVTIIDKLEEEFDISIPVEDMVPENFESLDTIYALITSIKGGEI